MSENLPKKKQDARIAVMRNTVAQGLNDAEFAMFLEIVKATKLNPFKREIWAIKTNSYTNKRGDRVEGKVQIFTGFNGFLAIANAHPQFDNIEFDVFRNENGSIDYCEARAYRKDRTRPAVARVYMSEFYRGGFAGKESNWDKMPHVMIVKVAKCHALREAFPQELGNLYAPEEMGQDEIKPTFEQINQLNAVQQQQITDGDVNEVLEQIAEQEELNV